MDVSDVIVLGSPIKDANGQESFFYDWFSYQPSKEEIDKSNPLLWMLVVAGVVLEEAFDQFPQKSRHFDLEPASPILVQGNLLYIGRGIGFLNLDLGGSWRSCLRTNHVVPTELKGDHNTTMLLAHKPRNRYTSESRIALQSARKSSSPSSSQTAATTDEKSGFAF